MAFYFFILFESVFLIFYFVGCFVLTTTPVAFCLFIFQGVSFKNEVGEDHFRMHIFFLCFYFLFFCGPCLLTSPPHTRVAYEGLPVWHPPRAVPQSIRLLIDFRISRWTHPFSTICFWCFFVEACLSDIGRVGCRSDPQPAWLQMSFRCSG